MGVQQKPYPGTPNIGSNMGRANGYYYIPPGEITWGAFVPSGAIRTYSPDEIVESCKKDGLTTALEVAPEFKDEFLPVILFKMGGMEYRDLEYACLVLENGILLAIRKDGQGINGYQLTSIASTSGGEVKGYKTPDREGLEKVIEKLGGVRKFIDHNSGFIEYLNIIERVIIEQTAQVQ